MLGKKISPCILSIAKDDRTMTSGCQAAPYFRRYGRELVSKPAISIKRKFGGAIIERLIGPAIFHPVAVSCGFLEPQFLGKWS